ncbi:MAG: DUF4129 domain-containing protein [Acidimicrobiales bacterium]
MVRTSGPDPDLARHVARQILARPEFQIAPESPIDRLRHWVLQQIARAVDAALSGRATVLGIILLVLVAVVAVLLVRRFSRSLQRDPGAVGVSLTDPRRAPAEWLAEAAECEQRGDWRGSLRARYRALVAELAARHLVDEIPGRTTGEYRLLVGRALPDAADPFNGATDLFEAAVYGDRPAGPAENDAIAGLSGRVLARTR